MKLLLNRELRRQAPAAAGMLGLGVLLLLVLWATTLLADRPRSLGGGFVEAVFLIIAVGTPWLLSTTAVAPDQETGAEAFLVTMPVDRGRLAIMRGAVALGLSVSVLAITAVMCTLAAPLFGDSGASRSTDMREMVVAGLIAGGVMFTAGSLATVLVRQTLVAFVAAPALAAAPAAAYFWVSEEIVGLPKDLSAAVIGVSLPALLLIAAWRGYTRPTRELGWRRPTRFALGVTGALFLTCAGLTTTALALDRMNPIYDGDATVRSSNGASASVVTSPRSRFHWRYSSSVVALAPSRTFVFRAGAPDVPIEMPQGLAPFSFSPDGSKLLGRLPNGELMWIDLETNEQRRALPPKQAQGRLNDRRQSLGFQTWGHYWGVGMTYLPVLWHDGVPWIAHPNGLSQWDGRASRDVPAGTQVLTAHGRRGITVADDGQARLLDLAHPEPVDLAPPPGTRPLEWTLGGPQGRYVLTLARSEQGECSLWALDAADTLAWRKLDVSFPKAAIFGVGNLRYKNRWVRPPGINLSFSPFGPFVSYALDVDPWTVGSQQQPIRTIDLRTGASAVVHEQGTPVRIVTDWRPDGHLLTSAGAWDPATGSLTPYTDDRGVLTDQRGALLFAGKLAIYRGYRFNTETGMTTYRGLFDPR